MMTSSSLDFAAMDDRTAARTLEHHRIGLTVDEARAVQNMLGRAPTLTEATIWGIQGSEHCSYKSSRRFLRILPTDGSRVILGPKEDSGIIAITDGPKGRRWGLVISHESHNHPSQIVPFEGAATGIGGCVRDVVCMGARVIGAMDSLRLGDLRSDETRAIASEVCRGIAGYGNPLGIPNLGGDTVFDASYNTNCLVNAITVGIVREDEIIHSYVPEEAAKEGYDIIIVGKATDRSGFGGASFASVTMNEEKKEENTGAVQEPNPFLERHLLASTYHLFDILAAKNMLSKVSFKDLGAGGVVCASVEQVAPRKFGATIDLNRVHTSMSNLPAEVVACAETQERFCWVCHPSLTDLIVDHYNKEWDLPSVAEHARASVIGKVTDGPEYVLTYDGQTVCNASSEALTSGLLYDRPIASVAQTRQEPSITCNGDRVNVLGQSFSIAEIFRAMIAHPNHASKWPIIRHYDKSIIGNTIIEPGEGDSSVIMPLQDLQSYVHAGTHPGWDLPESDRFVGVALSSGGNGRYGRISAYLQGLNAVIETMRNVAASGALPRALTDCLNYANPEVPEKLQELADGIRGIADAARSVNIGDEPVPVISGNVSLYNATPTGSIDPTAIVACAGVMPDARKALSMQLRSADSELLFLGRRKNECGGSAYYEILETLTRADRDALLGANVPHPDGATVRKEIEFLHEAIGKSLIRSCHDVSDGGLLLALFEMTLPRRKTGGSIGVDVDIAPIADELRNDVVLFSESGGFVIEIAKEQKEKILHLASTHGCAMTSIGITTSASKLFVHRDNIILLNEDLASLLRIHAVSLQKKLS
jgi:phosphoribosylformylglycinamidine synthase